MNHEELTKKMELLKKVVPAELLAGYDLETIARGKWAYGPGKFEGEPFETLYFYDAYLSGGGAAIEVTDDEKQAFDIDSPFVYLAESSDGFVTLEYYETREEAEEREFDEYPEEEE